MHSDDQVRETVLPAPEPFLQSANTSKLINPNFFFLFKSEGLITSQAKALKLGGFNSCFQTGLLAWNIEETNKDNHLPQAAQLWEATLVRF